MSERKQLNDILGQFDAAETAPPPPVESEKQSNNKKSLAAQLSKKKKSRTIRFTLDLEKADFQGEN